MKISATHDQSLELGKLFTLKWLGKEICYHQICGAVINQNVAFFHLVCNIEISDIECASPLA